MSTLKVPVSAEDHIMGDVNAPNTLVEYGDFQCPHCRSVVPITLQLVKHFGKQLRFVYRHFPISKIHPLATVAAETAEFAGAHGRFWEMHALIYENQPILSIPYFFTLAKTLNLPADELEEVLADDTYEPRVKNDFLGGIKSGVNGTPTFYINDQRYNGSYDFASLASAIESVFV